MVSAINEAVYNTDRTEVFAIFCKLVSRDNPNFRRQLLTNLQNNFKLRLKLEEEKRRSLGNIRIISELYMLQLMNARIMKECMKKLLAAKSPLALEKLVKLFHIAGPALRA